MEKDILSHQKLAILVLDKNFNTELKETGKAIL